MALGRLTGFTLELNGTEEELRRVLEAMGAELRRIHDEDARARAEVFVPFGSPLYVCAHGFGSLTGSIQIRQDIPC